MQAIMWVTTNEQMRELDQAAIGALGLPAAVLMERAGQTLADICIAELAAARGDSVLVLAGAGNNGGDGMVAARRIADNGAPVTLVLAVDPDDLRGDVAIQYRICGELGLDVVRLPAETADVCKVMRPLLDNCSVVVDALFGTGLSRAIEGPVAELIRLVNASGKPVIAADIPSGINGDSGAVMGEAIQATRTVTFGLPKRAHFLPPGSESTGELVIADIGFPTSLLAGANTGVRLMGREVAEWLPVRSVGANKGTNGRALVVGGSTGMVGAPALAGLSALRIGAGLVTLAVPSSIQQSVAALVPEVITVQIADSGGGCLTPEGAEQILAMSDRFDVVLIGPGLSQQPPVGEGLEVLLPRLNCPVVIDADALNWIAHSPDILNRQAQAVLTPHPGEMGRLVGISTEAVQADRFASLGKLIALTEKVCVLKGRHTLIGEAGQPTLVNVTGNAGLATAGTGDVLTGAIGGLMAQGVSAYSAAALGVYLHGRAGDLAAEEIAPVGFIAGEVAERLPPARRRLAQGD